MIICKHCNSANVIRSGTYNCTQYYYCKDCKHRFSEMDSLPKMKTPIEEIAAAMNMYYGGSPIDAIQSFLSQQYGHYLSEAAIYKWIIRFTKEAIARERDFKPSVGNRWLADETGLNVGNRNVWIWDIIDAKTRYLLASHVSTVRLTEDAQILIEKAIRRAGKMPDVIITDKLRAYIDGIDLATGGRVAHIRSKPFTDKDSTNIIERFHGTLKQRINVIHHFKDLDTARLLTEGFLVHYNFFKEHESLGNESPVEHMKIDMPFTDWGDIVRHANYKQSNVTLLLEPKPIHAPQTARQRAKASRRVSMRNLARRRQKQSQPSLSAIRGVRIDAKS